MADHSFDFLFVLFVLLLLLSYSSVSFSIKMAKTEQTPNSIYDFTVKVFFFIIPSVIYSMLSIPRKSGGKIDKKESFKFSLEVVKKERRSFFILKIWLSFF